MDAAGHTLTAWIDDEGTCEPPVCVGGINHLYEFEGTKTAIRCSTSLSKDEKGRVFHDDVLGRSAAKDYIRYARSQKKHGRQREDSE